MDRLNKIFLLSLLITATALGLYAQKQSDMGYNNLSPGEERIIINKGTEAPWSGEYVSHKEKGIYLCKRCDAPLYSSDDKFDAHCGWPGFDDEIKGAVTHVPDIDGIRTEIICTNCGGHLGHLFLGEGYTEKNTRHCVNSLSLNFRPQDMADNIKEERALFAGGCFWGMEYFFRKKEGVLSTSVGYTGGHAENPSYEDVLTHTTGHAEVMEVIFDPKKVTFEELAMYFFEIHDPTQVDRQGPDIGEQYRSEIFYLDGGQKETAEKLIGILRESGYDVTTRLTEATTFYPAENYHQDYYEKTGGTPYCHAYQKRFNLDK